MQLAVIDYDAGNIFSLLQAFKRLGCEPLLTRKEDDIRRADKIIFPGQGEAGTTMKALQASGLASIIPTLTQPVLGICIGMHLMCATSEESQTQCLGIFPEKVQRFTPRSTEDKVPQLGWNNISALRSPLFKGIDEDAFVYYLHSYFVPQNTLTIASTTHCGVTYSAAMQKANYYALQFHPEKSGAVGEKILQNFLTL